MVQKETSESMLYINFNQDASCFAVGTETGFRIYNTNPYKGTFIRDLNGGIGIIEMLYRSNILALVGGGKCPKFAPNKVVIWDDHQGKVLSEMRFTNNVKNVKLKRDKIFVVCENKIYVFNFRNFELIESFETFSNSKGLISISTNNSNCVLAFPNKENRGQVFVKNYDNKTEVNINAHKNNLICIQLNSNGNLLATASEKGTLIRIFNTKTKDLIKEFRRGSENAEIFSISFERNGKFLAVSSEKNTIHIFILNVNKEINNININNINNNLNNNNLNNNDNDNEDNLNNNNNNNINNVNLNNTNNHKNFLGKISGLFGINNAYLNSEYSFSQFKINELRKICAFGPDNSIFIISDEGKYYQAQFDPNNEKEFKKVREKNIYEESE